MEPSEPKENGAGLSRRTFVETAVAGTVASALPLSAAQSTSGATIATKLKINGKPYELELADPRVSLLDLLREHLKLTGTKKGCDHGQCGACTVLVNGVRINSCLSLAVMHDGDEITTIEGLAQESQLHPMQTAFIEHDGLQCGYCTPGQICSAVALLDEVKKGAPSFVTPKIAQLGPIVLTDDEIRERMSGNICRCGAYVGIVAAVRSVAGGSKA
ncbi:MAG TPA: 2Fe-2S iron-sulfur cluster-binding protein [Bryobacteraceae bacterium]|nr:2Fe-2S iron-sulfur cluster-binding protein [Bryobacteraceae bacterium]